MIKSEKQKTRTLKLIDGLKADKEKFLSISQNLPKEVREANIGSMDSMIGELERDLIEYEKLKAGIFELPKNVSFIEVLNSLPKIRISKGLSQKDLADLIGITKQQINRYEEQEYQNVSVEKVNRILDVLDINLDIKSKKECIAA